MGSTGHLSDKIEDSHALTLRPRTLTVDFHGPDYSQGVHDHGGRETPLKRRKMAAILDAANEMKSKFPEEEIYLSHLRSEDDANEEHGSSATDSTVRRSTPPVEGDAIEAIDASKQPDETTSHSVYRSSPAVVEDTRSIHKRFRSEEVESDIGRDPDLAVSATKDESSADAQAETHNVSNDASDEEGGPEIFSTHAKQSLGFIPAVKAPKSRKPKPRSPAPLALDHEESASIVISRPRSVDVNRDDQASFPAQAALPTSKRRRSAGDPASKRAKDIIRDGITYRTLSNEGLRGQTSPWLPAKASPESRMLKERLLVRKRVQEVNIGPRPRFTTGR